MHPVREPAGEPVQGGGGDSVAARVTAGDGRSTGLPQQVVPRAVEQAARDHLVGLAVCHEHGQVGQPARVHGQAGIERQGAVEDRRSDVPGRVGQDESAGKGCPSAEPDEEHRPPRGRHLVQPIA